jgi:hypothetical protein
MATKLSSALHAQSALETKRFASTVKDLAAAKQEAKDMVKKMRDHFKVQVLGLKATAKAQTTKLKEEVTKLRGTITKNKIEQLDVNRKVNAEIRRMTKLGNDHEATLAKKDKELSKLIKKNKEKNEKAMLDLTKQFNDKLQKIQERMKKDRAHHERQLSKETGALYSALAKNKKLQEEQNKEMNAARVRMELDAKDALRDAKKMFAKKVASLSATVVANDKKADKKIKALVGVVDENAVKDAEGRKALRILANANKNELKTSVRNAIQKGEMRALQVEKAARGMNSKVQDALNMKITADIGKLRKHITSSVEDLQLSNKEARDAMKKEILFAVRGAAKTAKTNLKKVVKWSNGEFNSLEKRLENEKTTSLKGREALEKEIKNQKELAARAIKDAVSNQDRALLALKTVTAKKIKKSNKKLTAYGEDMKNHAEAVTKQMGANIEALNKQVDGAKAKATQALNDANAASINRKKEALDSIKKALKEAGEASTKKFGKLYKDMASDRIAFDDKLSAAAIKIQESIAKRSALYDARFRTTVKDIDAARKQAAKQVDDSRKEFTASIVGIVSTIKEQETRITGLIQEVGTEVASLKSQQKEINDKTDAELKRILTLSDTRFTEARKARGAIRKVIDEHKAVAYNERNALAKHAEEELRKARAYQARLRREAAEDLTKATKELYGSLSVQANEQKKAVNGMKAGLKTAKLGVEAAMTRAKNEFQTKLLGLTNTVGANQKTFERAVTRITGVVHDWKKTAGEDRKLLRDEVKAMDKDLNKAIVKAIAIGEAKAKAVQERGMANINAVKRALSGEIAKRVEDMADEVFKAVIDNRGKIADNYLALKAYANAKADDIIDYTTKYQGKGLFSLGDLLGMVAAFSKTKTKPAEGIGAGASKVKAIYGGKSIKVSTSFTKANGLVDEWTKVFAMVRSRWSDGLGHYMLGRVQYAMQREGLLSVGSVSGKSGEFVFINAHAVGLSNRLSEFNALAARSVQYQDSLAKLAAKLPKKMKVEHWYAKGPEWQGD